MDRLKRWFPALMVMGIIFWFSSQPRDALPDFGWLDWLVKKSGHVVEYAILASSYWFAFDFKKDRRWLAWLLALVFSASDEFHQSFVPGRFPSVLDVLIFDNLGALIGLWIADRKIKK